MDLFRRQLTLGLYNRYGDDRGTFGVKGGVNGPKCRLVLAGELLVGFRSGSLHTVDTNMTFWLK